MMHCICNLMLEPGRWNFPCLGSSVCAHDALYLQSHFGALKVELSMPRVLCVCSSCTVFAISWCSPGGGTFPCDTEGFAACLFSVSSRSWAPAASLGRSMSFLTNQDVMSGQVTHDQFYESTCQPVWFGGPANWVSCQVKCSTASFMSSLVSLWDSVRFLTGSAVKLSLAFSVF